MNKLKKLVGQAALGVVTATILAVPLVMADSQEGNSCSLSSGSAQASATCNSSSLPQPCCILGTDGSGAGYNIATCCKGKLGSDCAIKYDDGSVTGGGLVKGNLTVSGAGCTTG
jgi:hypothetical protein